MKKPKLKPAEQPVTERTIETFSNPLRWPMDRMEQPEPSCFNGTVNYRKYEVRATLVDETIDVLQERLLKLWRESDNHHHMMPLRAAAAEVFLVLPADEFGRDRKDRKRQ